MAKVRRFVVVACIAALASVVLGAGRAEAGLLGCSYPDAQQSFAAWGDNAQYVPVPGGSFEEGRAGWTFSRGAEIVDGNEPFGLGSPSDSHSLLLPPGSSAMTPGVCLAILTPTLRFVGSSSDGSPVRVSIYTKTLLGLLQIGSYGSMSVGTDWDASSIQTFTLENVLGLLNLGRSNIYFKFTSTGDATVRIDDVLLDPFLCR